MIVIICSKCRKNWQEQLNREKQYPPVALVGPYPPVIGGTASFLSRLVPQLEQKGISCEVFNTQKGNPGTGILERLRRLLLFLRVGWKVLFSQCRIVHCQAVNWANLIGNAIVLILNRPFKNTVLTLHAGDLLSKLTGKRICLVAKLLLRLPQVITTVTPELKDAVLNLGVKHVFFIPNDLSYLDNIKGIIPEYIQAFVTIHQPLIVTVGAMERVYGVDVLVRSIPILKKRYPTLGVIIIAYKSINPVYKAEIELLISELKLSNQFILPMVLSNVQAVVKLADVFVRPTMSDGDSIAVREAASLGIPVVASDVGFRPAGVMLFPVGNFVQLAMRIIDALSYPSKINEQYKSSDQRTVMKYKQIYDFVLNKQGSKKLDINIDSFPGGKP